MATLEKIRSKSVLLVSIIFVALFLFIITIIDNPLGLFMDQTTVVNVKGEKIGYDDYQRKINELREQNPELQNADDEALQALVSESLLRQEYDALGLTVTPEEISEVMVGESTPYQILAGFYQQFQGAPADVLQAIQNPEAAGLTAEQAQILSNAYKQYEDQVENFLLAQKFFQLVNGTITANKLDTKAMFDEANTTYTIASVGTPLTSVTDTVTEAEIEKYYNAHRQPYKLNEPSRYVRYVTVNIAPSPEDRMKAAQEANQAVAQIVESGSMDVLAGNSAFVVNNRQEGDSAAIASSGIPGLQRFVENAEPGTVQTIYNGAYTASNPRIIIARLNSRENKVNGAQVRQLVLDPTVNGDSVLALLNTPGTIADSVAGVVNTQVSAWDFSQLPKEVVDTVRAAGIGKYVLLGTGNGTNVAVTAESYDAPKPIYEYSLATYNIDPSRATIEGLNSRMREFLIATGNTAAGFNEDNAAEQGLNLSDALISASSNGLGNLDDTRNIVAWAMDAKKGEVSRPYTDSKNTHLTAAAVVDIYKGDYIPATYPAIHEYLKAEATLDKAANKLIGEYTGKGNSLAEYQTAMDAASVDTIRNVNVSSLRYADLGGLRGLKAGDLIGPLRYNNRIVVVNVVDAKEGEMPYDEESNKIQYARQMQNLISGRNNLNLLLLGDGKIQNRILKFTRQ